MLGGVMHAVRLLRSSACLRAVFLVALATLPVAAAQEATILLHPLPANVILPQRHVIELLPRPRPPAERVQITGIEAEVSIRDGIATTALTIRLHNPGHALAEAIVLLPVPDQAVVRAFTFDALGTEAEARLLPREEARRIYDAIVARSRDPALLEFAGLNVVRSSAFPLAPRAHQAVTLTYEQVLPADGDRRDYVLPRSAALDCEVPWQIQVRLQERRPIGAIYSPSHEVNLQRGEGGDRATITLQAGSERRAGSFVLSYLTPVAAGPNATVFLHRDATGPGGYFLLLAGAPHHPGARDQARLHREVTLVLDRSGSMRGEKLEQAKEAARQFVAGLEAGDRFHIISYNEVIETCHEAPVPVTADTRRSALEFIDALTARGGTNIHDALREALRPAPADGFVPMVLFLTDGMPTVGPTSEKVIRELATAHNPHARRIFTFGVGTEVNTPLLQSLALAARGVPTFVLPGEDIEVKMSAVFRRLAGPVLANPVLTADDGAARLRRGIITDVLPQPLPDIFAGDETLIFGRYTIEQPFELKLAARDGSGTEITVAVDPGTASARHSFVPRLWAARRIGVLVAAVRELGADGSDPRLATREPAARELIDEIVRLSTEFGILTEYTAFLAEEGQPLPAAPAALARARHEAERSAPVRTGGSSLSMDSNNEYKISQRTLNPGNRVLNESLVRQETRSIQQMESATFYQRGNRWIDSRLAAKGESEPKAARVVELGTDDHRRLIDQLVRENRQAAASLPGDVYLEVDGETVLLRNG